MGAIFCKTNRQESKNVKDTNVVELRDNNKDQKNDIESKEDSQDTTQADIEAKESDNNVELKEDDIESKDVENVTKIIRCCDAYYDSKKWIDIAILFFENENNTPTINFYYYFDGLFTNPEFFKNVGKFSWMFLEADVDRSIPNLTRSLFQGYMSGSKNVWFDNHQEMIMKIMARSFDFDLASINPLEKTEKLLVSLSESST